MMSNHCADPRPPSRRLIADIGGTNARFALVGPEGGAEHLTVLPVGGFPGFLEALAEFRATAPGPLGAASIAAAGPRSGGRIDLTNAAWIVEATEIGAALEVPQVRIWNDLEAVALALPDLERSAYTPLRSGAGQQDAPRLAVNVGTGFGSALAVPRAGGWAVCAGEPGYMALPSDLAGIERVGWAAQVEDVLSGRGYARLADGREGLSAADRTLFSALLGRMTGELVLATGAWGGVFLCGGVLGDFDHVIDREVMLAELTGTRAMADRLARVPVHRITDPTPALTGLARRG